MPLNFLCCFSHQSNRQDEGGESDEGEDSSNTNVAMISTHNPNQNLEDFGGARPRVRPSYASAVNTSNPISDDSLSLQLDIRDEDILPTITFHASNNNNTPDEVSEITTLTTSHNDNYEEEDEEDSDMEKFYSFKCLVCYKSEIPKQVILPCGHSQCCEACFKQMRKRYRRSRRYHLKTLQKESIRPGHDIHCPTCRQDGILCHLFLGEEDLTREITPNITHQ